MRESTYSPGGRLTGRLALTLLEGALLERKHSPERGPYWRGKHLLYCTPTGGKALTLPEGAYYRGKHLLYCTRGKLLPEGKHLPFQRGAYRRENTLLYWRETLTGGKALNLPDRELTGGKALTLPEVGGLLEGKHLLYRTRGRLLLEGKHYSSGGGLNGGRALTLLY